MARWSSGMENSSPQQYILLNWLICIPPLLFTILRLYVRWRHVRALYWDDILAMFSFLSLITLAILNQVTKDSLYIFVNIYNGRIAYLSGRADSGASGGLFERLSTLLKLQFSYMIVFWTGLWCVKGSLLLFYRRLLTRVDGYMKWWWAAVVFNVAAYFVTTLYNSLSCLPLSRRFSPPSVRSCSLEVAVDALVIGTALDLATDLTIMLLPVRLLIGLHITWRQKFSIGCIFCLGFVVMIFSIIRMVACIPLIRGANPSALIGVAMWSILEQAVAVVIVNLPPLKVLIKIRGQSQNASDGTGSKRDSKLGSWIKSGFRPERSREGSQATSGTTNELILVKGVESKSTVQAGMESHRASDETVTQENSEAIMVARGVDVEITDTSQCRLPNTEKGDNVC